MALSPFEGAEKRHQRRALRLTEGESLAAIPTPLTLLGVQCLGVFQGGAVVRVAFMTAGMSGHGASSIKQNVRQCARDERMADFSGRS